MKAIRFIVLANPVSGDFFIKDLIQHDLFPEMIVCEDPFYSSGISSKNILKKIFIHLCIIIKQSTFKKNYHIYFLAKKYSIKTWPSQNVNSLSFSRTLKKMDIDYAFVFTFKLLSEKIFNIPKFGTINFHPSFLPMHRGANPCNWVILKNEKKTGITFHYIDEGIDTGSIIEQHEIPLSGFEDSKILESYLYYMGSKLFIKLIMKLKHEQKLPIFKKDNSIESYDSPFKRKHIMINKGLSSEEILRTIKASASFNGAIFKHEGKEYSIIDGIVIDSADFVENKFPFFMNGNIYIKSADTKIVCMLLSKKQNKL